MKMMSNSVSLQLIFTDDESFLEAKSSVVVRFPGCVDSQNLIKCHSFHGRV